MSSSPSQTQVTLAALKKDMGALANREKAAVREWFFKTGKGGYGEGDRFLGIPVPDQRKIARAYRTLSLRDVQTLLQSPIHEHRLTALFILISQFKSGNEEIQARIIGIFLKNTTYINNWDLVDSSAPYLLGEWLFDKDRTPLYQLAVSRNLWKRRIAIISTFAFIKKEDFSDTLTIAELMLNDKHDLIHKAVGWMLREVGNRDRRIEEEFLQQHAEIMPRTMLRYAIETFPESKRRAYLKK
jgi:3-methyladenine DNA glycosylase AlkD